MIYEIAKEFSDVPAGRYPTDGDSSGETFREKVLRPLLSSIPASEKLNLILDGAMGYPSSFLEEAFGGLVRKGYFSAKDLKERLEITARSPAFKTYEKSIWRHIDDASTARA